MLSGMSKKAMAISNAFRDPGCRQMIEYARSLKRVS